MLTTHHRFAPLHNRAFTLIELLVVMAAMGAVAAAIYGIFGTSMRLYTNGVSAARTSYAIREVFDRIAFDVAQSPGRYASPMALDTTTTPVQLNETLGSPATALGLCKVVAGPLQMQSNTSTSSGYTAAVLVAPPTTTDTTGELVNSLANMNIKAGDYIKLVIGDAVETKILTVSQSSGSWSLTFDPYKITYSTNSNSTTDTTTVPVYVVRYSAYVVLKDLNIYSRNRDCLALYDSLEVVARRGGISYNPPSRLKLPANYLTKYTELVCTDLTQTTLTGAGTGWQPFRLNYNSDQPTVLIQMGVKATEYDNLSNNADFYKTANLDTSVYLRSNDL